MKPLMFMVFSFSLLHAGCKKDKVELSDGVSEASLRNYITALSGDDFLGRKPFTEGETKTLAFLEAEARRIGLQPGNGNSYYQEVPLVEIHGHASDSLTLQGSSNAIALQRGNEYVAYTTRPVDSIDIVRSDLVFCGYGIVAPEYNWNDYEGVDMKGKTAVVLVNDPGLGNEDSTFFKGSTMTYYGRWTYKYEEAARQGAAGVLIIHETTMAGYPWAVVQNSGSGAKLNLDSLGYEPVAYQGWISLDAAKNLFQQSGLDLQKEMQAARKPGYKPVPLPYSASLKIINKIRNNTSKNFIAMIPGSEKPEEYIIFSAHWDHLGVGAAVEGDSIYNGAVDNATGSAAILAIAETLVKQKKNKRSIVFLWVTAEEQGLLGSAYYAEHPVFPPGKTVANINIDAMYAFGKMKDLSVIGYGQSELETYAERHAAKQGRYILPDQEPEKGYFFRSDHFNFAKIGIPAFYAKGAAEHWDQGKEYATSQVDAYRTGRYHQPSDEFGEDFDLTGIKLDADLFLMMVNELANNDDWPEWKDGSEFKALRTTGQK